MSMRERIIEKLSHHMDSHQATQVTDEILRDVIDVPRIVSWADDSARLAALESAGVANWDGYEEAMAGFYQRS